MKESPLFVKTFDCLQWILERTQHFPKSQRFFLAKRLNDAMFDFYEHIGDAVALEGRREMQCLRQADACLLRAKHYARLAHAMTFLSLNQYRYAAERLTEIGRLLGAWLKNAQKA